mmetsp:Transcript_35636/g.74596  ORF Transcript_35636/g.74596 Transcript_35636/m.74596 type:complete len:217 (+) Transcript_35636:649-1299(+)
MNSSLQPRPMKLANPHHLAPQSLFPFRPLCSLPFLSASFLRPSSCLQQQGTALASAAPLAAGHPQAIPRRRLRRTIALHLHPTCRRNRAAPLEGGQSEATTGPRAARSFWRADSEQAQAAARTGRLKLTFIARGPAVRNAAAPSRWEPRRCAAGRVAPPSRIISGPGSGLTPRRKSESVAAAQPGIGPRGYAGPGRGRHCSGLGRACAEWCSGRCP